MKKTYLKPETMITSCETIQILAGTTEIKTTTGPNITEGDGPTEEDYDFSNRSLWDDEE